jgi:gluconate 2-dehydrogenase gamma chain
VTMQQCMKVRTAKPCLFLSVFIRVHPWPIIFSRKCPILGMGLFRKIGIIVDLMSTRRHLLKTAAAAVALPTARGQHQHADTAIVQLAKPYKPKVLNPAQMEWVAKLVDLIIPRSDTPGASDAGVPAYIDRTLSRNARTKARFLEGMTQLDTLSHQKYGSPFSALSVDRQTELLTSIGGEKFFKLAKDLTIDGYYTSKPGLTIELGWNANTFLSEFKGCTHPEHQA